MSEWKEYKLSEVGNLQRGKSKHRPRYAFHLYGGPYPFIQTGQIKAASKYITEYEQTYSEAGLAQSKLWKKGTLCITIAANIAEIGILSFDACFPDSVIGFIPDKNKCDLGFAFYTLKHFQKELQQLGDGSVQDNINLGTFENIKFPLPTLPEQTAIAEVLSSLDDKIDLLQRQNNTLEQLAQTLFRQWFVEEAEEGWEETKLESIAIFYNGKSRPKEEGTIPVYGGNGILGYTNKSNYSKRSIIIGRVGAYCGSLFYEEDEVWLSDNALLVKAKDEMFTHFLFYLLKSMDLNSMAEGSSHPLITQTLLKSIDVILPPNKKIEAFEIQINEFTNKIKSNATQIRSLMQLRDVLLPKLMSGVVRVV